MPYAQLRLFMFHLRLIEECDVEVLVAPSFRCDARVFPPLRRHAEPMRRFVVMRRRSSSALSRHTDSAKNCMACCWIEMCCKVLYHSFRGAFHDELGQDGACHGHGRRDRADEAHPVHLASNGGSIVCRICASCHVARPLSKVGCINTAALPSQNGNEHIASISRFMAFPSCCHPAIVAVSASRAKVGRHAVAMPPSGPRSSCCPIQASGAAVPRARPPSRTRPVCTARPRSASRRVSSSGLATDPSPAGLPHCAAETLGGSSNFQTRALKTEMKFPSMSHACLCSLARALGCDKCGCASSSSSSSTSPDLSPATTIDYRERVRVVGTSTRAVACAFASEPQPSPTLQKHRSRAGVPK